MSLNPIRPQPNPQDKGPIVLLPPILIPLDEEHEQLAKAALANLLAPLFQRRGMLERDDEKK